MNSAPLFLGGKMENIIGRRFGRLFVVDCAERRYGKDFWTCRCQCGKYKEIQGRHLKSGNTRSCGCLRNERVKEAIFKELTGKRFGKLLVLSLIGKRRRGYYWKCLCDCGSIIDVLSGALTSGNTRSCGCLHKEVASQVNKERKQYNQYRFEGNIGIGICSVGVDKERLYLGLYSTYEEAVKVRLEAEKKYYGDYARDLKYR